MDERIQGASSLVSSWTMPEARVPTPPYPHGALPAGTRLGEFEVRRVLGVGGFGIVYLAFDHLLEREVALKEYMPSTLVDRNETMQVSLISQANADTFALGLRSFVNEARLLARFDHPSLLKVHRFWEANGTAYMAMALYKGRTARDVRMEMTTRPDEAWVRRILEPLLGAIEKLHSEDVYHRDIAPDNILVEADGRPVLLDFGAARRVITDRSQALTAILKPSYAPIEQYADVGGMKQGPWTDIYALGATVHFLLLGKPPPPAPGRSIQDTMAPLAQQGLPGCSPDFLALVDWMLAPLPNDRPQNVAVVRDALAGRVTPPRREAPPPFERTAVLPGAGSATGADEDATIVMARGQTAFPPPAEDATVVMPRSSMGMPAAGVGGAGAWLPLDPPAPAADDEDATLVRPYPTGMPASRPSAQAPSPPPATATATATATAAASPAAAARPPAPRPAADKPQRVPPPLFPPEPARPAQTWLVPVLAGVAVAAVVGGGLWWFLTRPVSPPTIATTTPPAVVTPSAAADPAPAPAPVPPKVEAAPAAAAVSAEPTPATAAVDPRPETAPPTAVRPPLPATARPVPAPADRTAPRPGDAGTTTTRRTEPAPAATSAYPAPTPAPAQTAPVQPPPAAEPPVAQATRPAPVEEARPSSPSERCAKELPLVRLICIDLACNRSEFRQHPECTKLRAEQAQKRHLEGN